MTSHDIVAAVRREHGGAKVGHAGTLDPFATGLLLVLLGRATRVQRFLMALPKAYETVARLGVDVDDRRPRGRDHRDRPRARPTRRRCRPATVRQRPPAYSAVKRRRRARLRAGARAGRRSRCPSARSPSRASSSSGARATAPRFAIDCSSGTYVRSLIADLGDAYCVELRRTAIGPFSRRRTPTRARVVPLARRAARSCRSCDARRPTDARRAAHGVAGRAGAAGRGRRSCCVDADGPDRDRRAARGRPAQALRRLPRREGHPAARRRAAPAPRRGRARSTASTSATARSIARRRHRPDLRPAPVVGRRARAPRRGC